MYWNKRIKTAKIGYLIISTLLCALGIFLIALPDFSAELFCRISGIIMLLFGLIKMIGYFSKDLYRLAFQLDLASGILLIALGIIMMIRANMMISIICIILGIYVLANALLKVQITIDAKAFGIPKWWLILTAVKIIRHQLPEIIDA